MSMLTRHSTKRCSVCAQILPVSRFHLNGYRRGLLLRRSACRDCERVSPYRVEARARKLSKSTIGQ